jgi:hypothetical protein
MIAKAYTVNEKINFLTLILTRGANAIKSIRPIVLKCNIVMYSLFSNVIKNKDGINAIKQRGRTKIIVVENKVFLQ